MKPLKTTCNLNYDPNDIILFLLPQAVCSLVTIIRGCLKRLNFSEHLATLQKPLTKLL